MFYTCHNFKLQHPSKTSKHALNHDTFSFCCSQKHGCTQYVKKTPMPLYFDMGTWTFRTLSIWLKTFLTLFFVDYFQMLHGHTRTTMLSMHSVSNSPIHTHEVLDI
eukprot:c45736_g1_i1 orf=1-315(-)